MIFSPFLKLAAIVLGLISSGNSAPTVIPIQEGSTSLSSHNILKRFDCSSRVPGLSQADCEHMSAIGMAGQGTNSKTNNGRIWFGTDGPNKFIFINKSGVPVTLIIWYNAPGDFSSSFMNVKRAYITFSAKAGERKTISVANGISGGWSFIRDRKTKLSPYGQLDNTWGEFTTGNYATVDISREVNMSGNSMSVRVNDAGCKCNMTTCAFKCKSGNTCGASGTYYLQNCENGSQAGATKGTADGNDSGGCQGWSNGGTLWVGLY